MASVYIYLKACVILSEATVENQWLRLLSSSVMDEEGKDQRGEGIYLGSHSKSPGLGLVTG